MKKRWLAMLFIPGLLAGFSFVGCETGNNNGTGPVNQAPAEPSNPTPADSAENQDINAMLSWSSCSDPQGDSVTYDVYFGKADNPPTKRTGQADTTYQPEEMDANTWYYWKIVAQDGQDHSTEGAVWRFKTDPEGNTRPGIPSIPSPADNATLQPVNITLSWECTDPDSGDIITYDVLFGRSDEPDTVSEGQGEKSWSPNQLETGVQYFWRVIAYDDHDHFTRSPLWRFTTSYQANRAPLPPYNPRPADQAVDRGTQVVIRWTCIDEDHDPLTFDVSLGTVSPPPLVESGLSRATLAHEEFELNTTYYWKVTAHDDEGHTTEGAVWSFTTCSAANLPPDVPSNPSPADATMGLNPVDVLCISWDCSDPDDDPLTYDVYFDDNPNPVLVETDHTNDLYFQPQLSNDMIYYWKILARDDHGQETAGLEWYFGTSSGGGEEWGTVTGTVTDAETGFALSGATVRSDDGPTTTTDASGNYSLTVSAGSRRITASMTGYSSSSSDVQVVNNGTHTLDFALTPGGGGNPPVVSGRVTDANTSSAITGATVSSDDNHSTTTDGTGNYSLEVGTGFRYITASMTGYRSSEWPVQADEDGTYNHDFALTPHSNEGGGGGAPDAFWRGTLQAGWEQEVVFDNNIVIMEGRGGFIQTVRIPVTGRARGFFHFNLDFEGNLNPRSFDVKTLVQTEGSNQFWVYDRGEYMTTDPVTNGRWQVWDSSWTLEGTTIVAIKLRIGSFNQNQPVYLDTPQIRPQ